MRSLTIAPLCLCLLSLVIIAGCKRETASSPRMARVGKSEPTVKHEEAAKDADPWIVGEPITHGNLTVFPVRARTPRNDDDYLTLDEGLREGVVQVYELGGAQEDIDEDDAAEEDADEATEDLQESRQQQRPDGGLFVVEDAIVADEVDQTDEAADDAPPQSTINEPLPESNEPQSLENPTEEIADSEEIEVDLDVQSGLDAEVERVIVSNNSNKPLYLMPGEIILGGQQDRCVAQEMVIPPGGEPVVVAVYCVEHGRWNGRSEEEQNFFAQSVADSDSNAADADEASDDKFLASPGVLHKRGRLAVQAAKDQSAVWDEVEAANAKSGNEVESSAFTGNYADPEIAAQLEPFAKALESPVSSQENIVGVIIAIDGEIQTADIFGSTPLFRKLWPKLLRSYAFDAAVLSSQEKSEESKEQSALTLADARQFLQDIKDAQVTETKTHNGLVLSSRTSDDGSVDGRPYVTGIIPVAGAESSVMAGGGGGFGGGGLGGAVHVGGLSH